MELSPNIVATYLRKSPESFTKADIVEFIRSYGIKMVNFMYPAEDGRVKTLNFIINSLEYLETILSQGERVDGSSLFPSFVEAGSSDLYVIPRFRTAFVDPFAEIPTLDMLCSFYDKDGRPFECDPYLTVLKASRQFTKATGMTFDAMGELEYYVIADEDELSRELTRKAITSRLRLPSSMSSGRNAWPVSLRPEVRSSMATARSAISPETEKPMNRMKSNSFLFLSRPLLTRFFLPNG